MYPDNYSKMNHAERSRHWVAVLHRGMRWAGEDGYEEVSIFDEALLDNLRSFDPDIDGLLPEVLTHLAHMELEDPAEFVAKVCARMNSSGGVGLK